MSGNNKIVHHGQHLVNSATYSRYDETCIVWSPLLTLKMSDHGDLDATEGCFLHCFSRSHWNTRPTFSVLSTLEKVLRASFLGMKSRQRGRIYRISWILSGHKGPCNSSLEFPKLWSWSLYEALWAAFVCFHKRNQCLRPSLNVTVHMLSAMSPDCQRTVAVTGSETDWEHQVFLIQPVSAC